MSIIQVSTDTYIFPLPGVNTSQQGEDHHKELATRKTPALHNNSVSGYQSCGDYGSVIPLSGQLTWPGVTPVL